MILKILNHHLYAFGMMLMCMFLLLWFSVNRHVFKWTPSDSRSKQSVALSQEQTDAIKVNVNLCICKQGNATVRRANMGNISISKEVNSSVSNTAQVRPNLPRTKQTAFTVSKPWKEINKTVDIVNDLYPFVDFKFVFPEISPTNIVSRDIFMIILVNSGATGKYRKRREIIRQTWGDRGNCEERKALGDGRLKNLRWLLVFVVGKAGPGTDDDKLNIAEAQRYNDMLIGNIVENYLNNIIKFYMGQVWASRYDIKYTMKTDDDVYVRIPGVLKYLVDAKFPTPFYGGWTYAGTLVNRVVGGKWTVSWKYYGETNWPRFNPGAFFILSSDLLNRLFNYANIRRPFHTDDAYVGIAMRDFGVKPTTIHSFHIFPDMSKKIPTMKDCYVLSKIALGHNVDPDAAKTLFNRLERMLCGKNPVKC